MYTSRHKYFDETEVKYTLNLNLLKGQLNSVWMIKKLSNGGRC